MPGAAASGHQLVLLDHGLYRRIDDAFRLEYAALWAALLRGDREGIKRHSAGMNAGALPPREPRPRPLQHLTKALCRAHLMRRLR